MSSSNLREKCGNFDYNGFLDKAVRHFHELAGKENGLLEKIFIIAGRTQAGKTSVKGVIQSLAGLLRIPLVILTKGVDESIDLHSKLVDLASGTLVEEKYIVVGECLILVRYGIYNCIWLIIYSSIHTIASNKKDKCGYKLKNHRVAEALHGGNHGGTLGTRGFIVIEHLICTFN